MQAADTAFKSFSYSSCQSAHCGHAVTLVHHLEFGLGAILPSHGACLPSWHYLDLSALLLGLTNGLLHKGGLSGLCPGVVKALLALKVGKVGLGSRHLLLLVLAGVGIAID